MENVFIILQNNSQLSETLRVISELNLTVGRLATPDPVAGSIMKALLMARTNAVLNNPPFCGVGLIFGTASALFLSTTTSTLISLRCSLKG